MALPPDEKLALLADPDRRRELNEMAQQTEGPSRASPTGRSSRSTRCSRPSTSSTSAATSARSRRPKARNPGMSCCDITVADDLRTIFTPPDRGADDESWKRRVEVWRDPRAIVGASDAGAHLDFLATFNYSTTMLAEAVRKRGLLATEEAVHCSRTRRPGCTGSRDEAAWPKGGAPTSSCSTSRCRAGAGRHPRRPPGWRASPLRRGRGHRARARERRRDRASRRVHRRAARASAAVRPRHRDGLGAGRLTTAALVRRAQ